MQVFVPLLVYGRNKYEYFANNPGVFTSQKDALIALFDLLVDEQKILDTDLYDDQDEKTESNSDSEIEIKEKKLSCSEMIAKTRSEINDFEDLDQVCRNWGDSYYRDGWRFEMLQRTVQQ